MKKIILIAISFVTLTLPAQVNQILPTNIYNGLIGNPSSPSISNPFATIADIQTRPAYTGFLGTTCSVNMGANQTYYGDLTASGSRFDIVPAHHSISFITGNMITAAQLSIAESSVLNTSTLTVSFYLTDVTASTDYFLFTASPSIITATNTTYIINSAALSIPINVTHTYVFKAVTPNWTIAGGNSTQWAPYLSFILAFD